MKSSIVFVTIILSVSFVTGCMEKLSIFQFKNIDGPILLPCPNQYPVNQFEPQYQYESYYNPEQGYSRGYAETECTCITKSTSPQSNTCYNPSKCVETECTCVTKPSVPASKCSAVTFVPLKQAQVIDVDCSCCKRQSGFSTQVDTECPCCNCCKCCSRQSNVPACQCSTCNCVPVKQRNEECTCTCTPVSQNSVNCYPQCSNYVPPQYATASYQEPGFYPTSSQQQYYGSLNSPFVYNSGYY